MNTLHSLPVEYLSFINDSKGIKKVVDNINSVEWLFRSKTSNPSITDKVQINAHIVPFHLQASLILEEAYEHSNDVLKHALEKINYKSTYTIAENSLNQLFYTEKSELFIFWQTSQTLEKIGTNFDLWLKQATQKQAYEYNETNELFFGTWNPVATNSTKYPNCYLRQPVLEIDSHGNWLAKYDEDDQFKSTYKVINKEDKYLFHTITESGNDVVYILEFKNDNTISLQLLDSNNIFTYERIKSKV